MIKIYNKKIGPCFILSEIGNNHGGDVSLAKKMIKVSAECGCDGVKFQTFHGKDIVSPFELSDKYPEWKTSNKFKYWYEFLDSISLPYDCYPELIEYAHELNIAFISTPTSVKTADFLNSVNVDAIKIASMDLTNIPMIKHISTFNKPVILSTGMGSLNEIKEAISYLDHVPLILLHCISNYPLDPKDANLLNIVNLKKQFNHPVGFSDHSIGLELDIAAVALGAVMIEKHFTLNRNNPIKIENHFSIEPDELKKLVTSIKVVQQSMYHTKRIIGKTEEMNLKRMRRSLMLNRDMKISNTIKEKDIVCVRPGTGLQPKYFDKIIGKKLIKNKKAYIPLQWSDFE